MSSSLIYLDAKLEDDVCTYLHSPKKKKSKKQNISTPISPSVDEGRIDDDINEFCPIATDERPRQKSADEDDDLKLKADAPSWTPNAEAKPFELSIDAPEFIPSRKARKICQPFLVGQCRFGDNCWNSHSFPRDRKERAASAYSSLELPKLCIPTPSEMSQDRSISPVSSVGSDFSPIKSPIQSPFKENEWRVATSPGLYVVINGKLELVPNISSSDPDIRTCWNFNTKTGCKSKKCAWLHIPLKSLRLHPTRGVVCDPYFGEERLGLWKKGGNY